MNGSTWSRLKHSTLERLAAVSAKCRNRSTLTGSWLIVPPASRGSMGDEAMMQGLAAASDRYGAGRLTVMQRNVNESWNLSEREATPVSLDFQGFGGWSQAALQICQHDALLIVGADVMDGCYGVTNCLHRLRLANLAARLGTSVTILGLSVGREMHPVVRDYWRRLHPNVRVCARDPRSRDRLVEIMG